MSNIEWTDTTWNPVVGCSRVSPGCTKCYAEVMAGRLARMGQRDYEGLTTGTGRKTRWTGVVRLVPERLALPLRWRKPRRIFVNSMSDLFHDGFTFEQIATVWAVMAASPHHTFQVLTKRPERALAWFQWLEKRPHELHSGLFFGSTIPGADHKRLYDAKDRTYVSSPLGNVWLGVSVENQATADERIPLLLQCPAAVRWVSAEPLLGAVTVEPWLRATPSSAFLSGRVTADMPAWTRIGSTRLDWIVVGGESGPGARPMHPDWARGLRDQCREAGVPFLFKQWGAWGDFTGRMSEVGDSLVNVILPSGRLVGGGGARHGSVSEEGDSPDAAWMVRVGKAKAGRLLDGRLWDEYPEQG